MGSEENFLLQQAQMVLDFNWTGEYTKPGPRLYPHQWSWDSALIALAYGQDKASDGLRERRPVVPIRFLTTVDDNPCEQRRTWSRE